MTVPIPDEMVEAAARALAECRLNATMPTWVLSRCWDEPPVPPGAVEKWRDSFRAEVRTALAAALSVCEIRQESGVAVDAKGAVSLCDPSCTEDDDHTPDRMRTRLLLITPWREVQP